MSRSVQINWKRIFAACTLAVSSIIIVGCGGGGSSTPSPVKPEIPDAAPVITQQAADQTADVGTKASFSVAVTGKPTPTVQWQRSADGSNWTDIAGANSTTLALSPVSPADKGARFRLIASNSLGQSTSQSYVLNVKASVTVIAGQRGGPGYSDGTGADVRFSGINAVAPAPAGGIVALEYGLFRRISSLGTSSSSLFDGGEHLAQLRSGAYIVSTGYWSHLPGGFNFHAFSGVHRYEPLTGSLTQLLADADLPEQYRSAAGCVPSAVTEAADGGIVVGVCDGIFRLAPGGGLTRLAAAAKFGAISGLAADASGQLYIADSGKHTIVRLSANGEIVTLAGLAAQPGSADGIGASARFNQPGEIAITADGSLRVLDTGNYTVRRVSATGEVSTVAGQVGKSDGVNGDRATASLSADTRQLTITSDGRIVIAERLRLRSIAADGSIQPLAGLPSPLAGSADGPAAQARFARPSGIAAAADGTTYIADNTTELRRMGADGNVNSFAGKPGTDVSKDGNASAASFQSLTQLAFGLDGTLIAADASAVRKIDKQGTVSTLATLPGGSAAEISALAPDRAGQVFVAAAGVIRKITPAGSVTSFAGSGEYGYKDGPASQAQFQRIRGIAVDANGVVYVADSNAIRKISADGTVSTWAGSSSEFGDTDGPVASARFLNISRITIDTQGALLLIDGDGTRIRRITPTGVVSTVHRGFALTDLSSIAPGRLIVVDERAIVAVSYF